MHIMFHKTIIVFLIQMTLRDMLSLKRIRKISIVAIIDESLIPKGIF